MSRKVRIGVFGANRGSAMIDYCMKMENAQLVAVCDRNEWLLEKVKKGVRILPLFITQILTNSSNRIWMR